MEPGVHGACSGAGGRSGADPLLDGQGSPLMSGMPASGDACQST